MAAQKLIERYEGRIKRAKDSIKRNEAKIATLKKRGAGTPKKAAKK